MEASNNVEMESCTKQGEVPPKFSEHSDKKSPAQQTVSHARLSSPIPGQQSPIPSKKSPCPTSPQVQVSPTSPSSSRLSTSPPSPSIQSETESRSLNVMTTPASDPLTRCLAMIKRANKDTEKFAALLMVTKLIKAEDLDESSKKKLIDAIGLEFLSRMLQTNEAPDGCPPFMFKSIALTILTCFASSCQGNTTLYGLVPVLCEIVSNPDAYEENLTLIKEAYQCLEAISSETAGRKAMINYEAVGLLVDSCVNDKFGNDQALKILQFIMNDVGSKMWENEPEAFEKLMQHITMDFVLNDSKQKFELCDIIVDLLHSIPENHEKDNSWISSLHKGLCDIIFSKLGRNQREKGLQLAGAVLETLGVVWLVTTGEKGQQLLLLMVHLACIEVRMSLEDRSFTEAVSLASSTTACYGIIENAIKFLINGALELEEKQKQQLYAALKGAFTAVLSFLKNVYVEDVESNNLNVQMFICATIRVLGAWLAEETSANKEEVYEILPFLINTAVYNFEWNIKLTKNRKTALVDVNSLGTKETLPDLFRFLLPGLCHLTAEDIPRYILLNMNIEKLLFDYLNIHWDLVKGEFNPNCKDDENSAVDDTRDTRLSSDAMITICNIFMNIVVQEPERVKEQPFYYSLLKFIFNRVPNVPLANTYLQLCGSMCTLGLMILRHQHTMVKSSDFTIFRFIQTTVRFLWDAFNVEESEDHVTLVIASCYLSLWDDLMELWYLGMHTLTILLPSIPWLCEFLLESEWPQTIVQTLITVRDGGLEPGVKPAYEDLLCVLVQSSISAKNILRDKGVLTLCENHSFTELSKLMNCKDIVEAL